MRNLIDRIALRRALRPTVGRKVGIFWRRSTLGIIEHIGWLGVTMVEPDGDTIVIRWHAIVGWEMGDEIDLMFEERCMAVARSRAEPEPAYSTEEQEELLMEAGF